MITVVFSGAPSSGKTTLARALSEVLTVFGHTVHHVEEAAKGIIGTRVATVQHYLLSAEAQLDVQRKCGAAEYMVIDSPIFLYGIYAHNILRVTDTEHAAYAELKVLCEEETRTYRRPGCKLFHIQPVYQLESETARGSEIADYVSKFASAYVRLADRDLMNRLECVLSYLNIEWRNVSMVIEKACEMAEMSVLNDHTS